MSVCPLISHAMLVPVFTCNDRLHGGGRRAAGFALCYYEIPPA